MAIRFILYKYNRIFIIVLFAITAGLSVLFFNNMINTMLSPYTKTVKLSPNYSFDQMPRPIKIPKPEIQPDKSVVPINVKAIGDAINFDGYIQGTEKSFLLITYKGKDYSLSKPMLISKDNDNKISFVKIEKNIAFFDINGHNYKMTLIKPQTLIPLRTE